MKPLDFPGTNVVFAANQPEYQPLPAKVEGGLATTCWRPSWRELWRIIRYRKIWLHQLTFDNPLQPQLPSTYEDAAHS